MEIEKNFQGYKKWGHEKRQHIHLRKGETVQDAIRYMRAHLEFFGRTDLDFDEQEIIQNHMKVLIVLRNADDVRRIKEERRSDRFTNVINRY